MNILYTIIMFSQLLNQTIIALCVNVNSDPALIQYYIACTQSLTAASIQSGIKSSGDLTSKRLEEKASKQVTDITGNNVWIFGGFIYTTIVKQSVILTFPVKNVIDNINISATPTTQTLTLSWGF